MILRSPIALSLASALVTIPLTLITFSAPFPANAQNSDSDLSNTLIDDTITDLETVAESIGATADTIEFESSFDLGLDDLIGSEPDIDNEISAGSSKNIDTSIGQSTITETHDLSLSTLEQAHLIQTDAELASLAQALSQENQNFINISASADELSVTSVQRARLLGIIPVTWELETAILGDGTIDMHHPRWIFLTTNRSIDTRKALFDLENDPDISRIKVGANPNVRALALTKMISYITPGIR